MVQKDIFMAMTEADNASKVRQRGEGKDNRGERHINLKKERKNEWKEKIYDEAKV